MYKYLKGTVNCYGFESCIESKIDSQTLSGTMNVFFYGYNSGSGSTIICGDSAACNVYCKSNGCENVEITNCGLGTCNVYCNESLSINCPTITLTPQTTTTAAITNNTGTTNATELITTTNKGSETSPSVNTDTSTSSSTSWTGISTSDSSVDNSLTSSNSASSLDDLDGSLFYAFWISWGMCLVLFVIIIILCFRIRDEKRNKLFLANQVSALSPNNKNATIPHDNTFPFATQIPGARNSYKQREKEDSMLVLGKVNLQASTNVNRHTHGNDNIIINTGNTPQRNMQMQLAAQAQARVQAQQAQAQAVALAMANAASMNQNMNPKKNPNLGKPALQDMKDEDDDEPDIDDMYDKMPPVAAPGQSKKGTTSKGKKISKHGRAEVELAQQIRRGGAEGGINRNNSEIRYEGQAETRN